MAELTELIRTERLALIEFLETLAPEDWSTPSLCGAWTVQEVAAHIAWAPVMPRTETMVGLVKAGFRLNKASADSARVWSRRGTEAILTQLKENAETGATPPGVPIQAALVEALVHAIDIRRPLGRPRPVPVAAFGLAADASVSWRWPLTIVVGGSARKRLAGLRLVAIGYDWSHGDGPEVHASGECVLRLLNGRPIERSELTGPGADQLFARVSRD
jgi:uncharacterized protein (TIGR03083 family)